MVPRKGLKLRPRPLQEEAQRGQGFHQHPEHPDGQRTRTGEPAAALPNRTFSFEFLAATLKTFF